MPLPTVQQFNEELLPSAKNRITQDSKKLQQWLKDGNFTLQLVCFAGACGTAFIGLSALRDLLSGNGYGVFVIDVYLFCFGVMAMVMEGANMMKGVKLLGVDIGRLATKLHISIHHNARFLAFVWGRGLLYFFLGTLLMNSWSGLSFWLGLYNVVTGLVCCAMAITTRAKLKGLKTDLGHVPTDEEIKVQFDKFDKDGSGTIDAAELKAAVAMLGPNHELSKSQEAEAMLILDVNGDGQIDFQEFKAWWREKFDFAEH